MLVELTGWIGLPGLQREMCTGLYQFLLESRLAGEIFVFL
jgi:hypothetical protein